MAINHIKARKFLKADGLHFEANLLEPGGQRTVEVAVAEVDLQPADDAGVDFVVHGEVGVAVLFLEGRVNLLLLFGTQILFSSPQH